MREAPQGQGGPAFPSRSGRGPGEAPPGTRAFGHAPSPRVVRLTYALLHVTYVHADTVCGDFPECKFARSMMAEVEMKTVDQLNVLSLSFTGSYEQTGARLDDLLAWVLRAGHPWSGSPAGIFYDDPAKLAEGELRAEVVVPVDEPCQGDDLVSRKRLPGAEMACLTYEGPMSGIGTAYEEVFGWVKEQGYRYRQDLGTREVYKAMPEEEEGGSTFVVELQVPVDKEPAETEPVETDAVEKEPVEMEPVEMEPVDDEPAE